jgi:hypothetical protein
MLPSYLANLHWYAGDSSCWAPWRGWLARITTNRPHQRLAPNRHVGLQQASLRSCEHGSASSTREVIGKGPTEKLDIASCGGCFEFTLEHRRGRFHRTQVLKGK